MNTKSKLNKILVKAFKLQLGAKRKILLYIFTSIITSNDFGLNTESKIRISNYFSRTTNVYTPKNKYVYYYS